MEVEEERVQAVDLCGRWAWAQLIGGVVSFEGWSRLHDLPVASDGPGKIRTGKDLVPEPVLSRGECSYFFTLVWITVFKY